MNRRQALEKARRTLTDAGMEEAALEGEILLRHTLDLDRPGLFSSLEKELTTSQEKVLEKLIQRRLKGEPTAYITGHREFYGLDFIVNHNVLIPRPETELLVEKAVKIARRYHVKSIADVGTGCGAIVIALAVNLPDVALYATDISPAALEIVGENSDRYGVSDRITFLQGNLAEPLPKPVDIIVANLPYVSEVDLTTPDFEPRLARDGGAEGLDSLRRMCVRVGEKLKDGGWLLLEIGLGQAEAVSELLQDSYPSAKIELESDLAGIERVVTVRLTRC